MRERQQFLEVASLCVLHKRSQTFWRTGCQVIYFPTICDWIIGICCSISDEITEYAMMVFKIRYVMMFLGAYFKLNLGEDSRVDLKSVDGRLRKG